MDYLDALTAFAAAEDFAAGQVALIQALVAGLEADHLKDATWLASPQGLNDQMATDIQAQQTVREASIAVLNQRLAALNAVN